MKNEITNAKVLRCRICRGNVGCPASIELLLKIDTRQSLVYFEIQKDLDKLLDVFEVNDFAKIEGKPCVVMIHNGYVRTVGHFLFGPKGYDLEENWVATDLWEDTLRKMIPLEL